MFKHAFIVPLIGGQALGQAEAFGTLPEYMLSYEPFGNNDQHIVNYWKNKVPYYKIENGLPQLPQVDVIGTTCPCAGLSALSPSANSDAAANDWMYTTTEFVLGTLKPKVLWGENAPGLAGKIGQPVVEKLYAIAEKHGYVMSVYRTKSLLHGIPQVRERSFYFFWKATEAPLFNYFDKTGQLSIEQLLESIPASSTLQTSANTQTPSKDDPWYRFVLEEMNGGMSHQDFIANVLHKSRTPHDLIEHNNVSYLEVGKWFASNGYEKLSEKCKQIHEKLGAGGNIMRRSSLLPKEHVGAFVGHLPTMMTHHKEDRYITCREALTIMRMPQDFELLGGKKNLNHVCQNVPVTTAKDIAGEVLKWLKGELDTVNGQLVYQYNHNRVVDIKKADVQTLNDFLF